MVAIYSPEIDTKKGNDIFVWQK